VEAATLPYRQVAGRIVLLKTTVDLKFRGNGVATEFIGSVLNELRQQNAKIAVYCPLVRAFIDSHPQYANMVDQKRPGPNFGITAEAANTDRSPAGENFDDESER
jgi:predicted GNAT family acetyltransferase